MAAKGRKGSLQSTSSKSNTSKKKELKDNTKDPVYKLKPNDIVEYTYILEGKPSKPEIHIICDYPYARDPSRVGSWPTLRFANGKFVVDNLYCWGEDTCTIKYLNNSHKVQSSIENGCVSFKLIKKRAKNVDKAN